MCRLHNAVDVDNEKDYKRMVINVLEQKPKKIKIIADMKGVQRSCLVLVCLAPVPGTCLLTVQ
jgi:hypothetical protein